MNYSKVYEQLIKRAINRRLPATVYTENHHILPKCLGGSDEKNNLVRLTPEEHFVAHQLLIKIHPKNNKIWWAAILMCTHKNGKRVNNKCYGWLRRGIAKLQREQLLIQSPSSGKKWIVSTLGYGAKLIKVEDKVPDGWLRGRTIKKNMEEKIIDALKRKEEKVKAREKEAQELYDIFLESSCLSIREFARMKSNFSHVSLIKMWKKNIPGFEESIKQGKRAKCLVHG